MSFIYEMDNEVGDTELQRNSDGEEMVEVSLEKAERNNDCKGVAEVKHKESQSKTDGEKIGKGNQKDAESYTHGKMETEVKRGESQTNINCEKIAEVNQKGAESHIDGKEVNEAKHKDPQSDIDSEKVAEVTKIDLEIYTGDKVFEEAGQKGSRSNIDNEKVAKVSDINIEEVVKVVQEEADGYINSKDVAEFGHKNSKSDIKGEKDEEICQTEAQSNIDDEYVAKARYKESNSDIDRENVKGVRQEEAQNDLDSEDVVQARNKESKSDIHSEKFNMVGQKEAHSNIVVEDVAKAQYKESTSDINSKKGKEVSKKKVQSNIDGQNVVEAANEEALKKSPLADEFKDEPYAQPKKCKEDQFGYCHLEKCLNLHKNCQFFYPKKCFPVKHKDSFDYDGRTKSLNVVTFNVSYQVNLPKLANYLMALKPLDVICIQEMMYSQIVRFLGLLRSKDCPWSYCARSPRCRSFILSTFPIKEVAKNRLPGSNNHEFVTVKIQGLYLTCLHLNAKAETIRLEQLHGLVLEFKELEVWGEPHIWAGDFNSVTREDYTDKEWTELRKERKELHTKDNHNDNEPKVEVAAKMVELGFTDCWVETGRIGNLATCR